MAAGFDRLRDLKAFDDTKAGVKGLVDAGLTTVPPIFRHPPESLDGSYEVDHVTIPVIDLADVTTEYRRAQLIAEVKAAAETVGFFQAVNHGVPEVAMAEMLAAVRRFNEEPAEAKRPYYTRDMGRRVRYQSNFDLFQSPAANWRDTLFLEMAPTGPAPEEIPPACRGIVVEYTRAVQRLGRTLLELLSEALGLHRGYLERDGGCLEGLAVASHYYPACPEPHLTLGTTRHSDPSFLTVLLQDGMGGLQVLHPAPAGGGGRWVDVPPVAGALVVNIGDFLQIMSNDRFKSVERLGGLLLPDAWRGCIRDGAKPNQGAARLRRARAVQERHGGGAGRLLQGQGPRRPLCTRPLEALNCSASALHHSGPVQSSPVVG